MQYHTARFESFGEQYYEHLFRLMAGGNGVTFHACSQAIFIIGKLVDFLSEECALKMTNKLIECMSFSNDEKYSEEAMKTLVASVLVNVPIESLVFLLCFFDVYNNLLSLVLLYHCMHMCVCVCI